MLELLMLRNNKIKILLVLILILLVSSIQALNYSVNWLYNQNSADIDRFNQLAVQLDTDLITVPSLTDLQLYTLPTRINNTIDLFQQLPKYSELEVEQQRVSDEFDQAISAYLKDISEYAEQIGFDPGIDTSQLDFAVKKEPTLFLSGVKSKFRAAVISYNRKNKSNHLWLEFDPAIELSLMTRKQKLKQVVGFGINGVELDSNMQKSIRTVKPGTINIFSNNVNNETQLKALIRDIKEEYELIPPFIAIDQEGGGVKRVPWDTTTGPKVLASLNSNLQCKQWSQRTELLVDLGITWNWGIVADVTSDVSSFIYPRVYGADSAKVAKIVANAVRCSGQIMNTLKHWPGHGATRLDTHTQIATISSNSKKEWIDTDSLPFEAGVKEGVDTIMVGHLIIPWLDKSQPASLSPKAIDFLRKQYKFEGLIVTDSLNMLVESGMDLDVVARKAFLAGSDVSLFTVDNPNTQQLLMKSLEQLLSNRPKLEAGLDQRVLRILTKKLDLLQRSNQELIPVEYLY